MKHFKKKLLTLIFIVLISSVYSAESTVYYRLQEESSSQRLNKVLSQDQIDNSQAEVGEYVDIKTVAFNKWRVN